MTSAKRKRSNRKAWRRGGALLLSLGLSLSCPRISAVQDAASAPGTSPVREASYTLTEGGPGKRPGLKLASLPSSSTRRSVLLDALAAELGRSMAGLSGKDPAPYFIGYQVTERHTLRIRAALGVLEESTIEHTRALDVDVRVGDFSLDNTHPIQETDPFAVLETALGGAAQLPVEDNPDAIRAILWRETDRRYQAAAQRFARIKAGTAVRVSPEDASDDFSREEPVVYLEEPRTLVVDKPAWEEKIRRLSRAFLFHPRVLNSSVSLEVEVVNKYLVTSEGTALQFSLSHARFGVYGASRAADGMDLDRFEALDARTLQNFPPEEEMQALVTRVINDLEALSLAPPAEPYTGPAMLSGRATGVFFHEIFGHRVEGHRQKDETEGQTFTKKIGKAIMPSFLSVYDVPGAESMGGIDLNGYYPFDDEGVPGRWASLVEEGVFKGFLLSRSPVAGFPNSNGHGRRQEGYPVVARQGNLIVESSRMIPEEKLKELLRLEAKRQGKEYGLYFEDISGGFTNTSRGGPQAFSVLPVMVYRVYVDGRPDELIRGVDIVGTPLLALGEIMATGDFYEIFNGYCGAESGFVPVSAIAPPMLIRQMETERRYKGDQRPPILPAPTPSVREKGDGQ